LKSIILVTATLGLASPAFAQATDAEIGEALMRCHRHGQHDANMNRDPLGPVWTYGPDWESCAKLETWRRARTGAAQDAADKALIDQTAGKIK